MQTPRKALISLVLAMLVVAATWLPGSWMDRGDSARQVVRANGPPYRLVRWTVDGGGAMEGTPTGYLLRGTAGQPDTGYGSSSSYVLRGGFWGSPASAVGYGVFLPLVIRGL